MENQPADPKGEAFAKVLKEIIPGASPELVREVVEDELGDTIPAPASEEVEQERIRRAQAEGS